MSSTEPTLYFLCGKIASGKSTFSNKLGEAPGSVVVREDHWLARLYPGEQSTLSDYVRNSTRLRGAMTGLLIDLLRTGVTVVLDFPANTPGQRAWMRTLFLDAKCAHQLHYLDVSDELCKARLHRRNESGKHEFAVSDEDFDLFTSHFVPPSNDEGFNVVVHRQ